MNTAGGTWGVGMGSEMKQGLYTWTIGAVEYYMFFPSFIYSTLHPLLEHLK